MSLRIKLKIRTRTTRMVPLAPLPAARGPKSKVTDHGEEQDFYNDFAYFLDLTLSCMKFNNNTENFLKTLKTKKHCYSMSYI